MATIDGERLLNDLRTLREFGARGNGVVRPTFSDDDMAARRWLREKMTAAGLDARIDGVGNVVGVSPNAGPALLIGSHCDTQPEGGWLDGAMGVVYALEVARTLRSDPATAHLAVDVVAWADEEGTYRSCLGSASFVGDLTADDFAKTNASGETVAAAIARVGLTDIEPARFDPDRHIGYLEAHIEQGPYLDDTGRRIGVVTSIVGIRSCEIRFVGEQNHAGTTPMHRRKDAAVAMFDVAVRVRERLAEAAGPTSVWTMGNAVVHPGAESIVPGRATLTMQWRDADAVVLGRMASVVDEVAAEMDDPAGVRISVHHREAIAPTVMDDRLASAIAAAADAHVPGEWVSMPSAAGHDPMVLSHHLPCAMLFIPSIGGVSHDFAEDSRDDDIVLGCQVLADATARLLG